MPYPSQVSRDTIVTQAWQLIEADGVEALSLGKLARELGIKAPSLYRHVGNKAKLLQAVNLHTSQQLVAGLNEAAEQASGDAKMQIAVLIHSYRSFALAHPHTYTLAFTNTDDSLRPDENALEQLALPLQQLMTAVSGEEKSLAALRGAMALVHGFVMLELHGQLRRGRDLGADFATAVHAYLNGW
ncbi:TetR/AcrR family transcriptional regulator [Candidatus Leptofilum sp.]|uniref:TetR/AcrR family transcriptional regulator n=1 Tax=Candidatus Leptofilum sp. TaxID=3241576 RepID=UPI003B5AA804